MSAPAPIFRALDANGDWQAGQGLASYATGQGAIALDVKTSLLLFLGDAFWAATSGIDWLNLLGNRNTLNAILAATRATIANVEGVTAILSVDYSFDRVGRVLHLTYRYADVYSVTAGAAQITV